METSSFAAQALLTLKRQAEAAAKHFPPLHHMLVLPPGESISIPSYGSQNRSVADSSTYQEGRPGHQRPKLSAVAFGTSQVATELPPKRVWPAEHSPFCSVVAERSQSPSFQPLTLRPYRIHLFFGDAAGLASLKSLSGSIAALRKDLIVARGGTIKMPSRRSGFLYVPNVNTHDPLYLSPESLHGWPDVPLIDMWMCTIHWWAWVLKGSPLYSRPRVLFNGHSIEVGHNDRGSRMLFSYLARDVFTLTAGTIDQLLALPSGHVTWALLPPKQPNVLLPIKPMATRPPAAQALTPATASRESDDKAKPKLRKCVQVAGQQYLKVLERHPKFAKVEPNSEVYIEAKELAALEDERIASKPTWLRYVRDFRRLARTAL